METHYEEKTAKMCVQGVSGDTLRAKNSKNVCQKGEWKHITKEKKQKCVPKAEVETHDEEKTATMCIQGGSGNTLRRENSKNVRPRLKWRHITRKRQQKCVTKAEVETHYKGKTAKMCVQGRSGDTLRRENSKNVRPRLKWRHITKEKQQQYVSKAEVETHYKEKTDKMCIKEKTLRHIYRVKQKECVSD
ncbi:hypothetical protein [Heyndrickxia oleronia]|uniref:hypothetical protein n=1 Tax=Heyndrickxia oleronia TaxID=38875 RepID=UPI002431F14B|nr:hypothetical protein [Heyndrickxia oleronia]MCI1590793.1 hypothetical protein [Heyndrickxia oleronia]MCI1612850.1 hypothetical protein [Heyndrickxia oleronia]MCI1744076.1 hypothetical protein [Heyndrickxia oleronia]MCI1761641.1 hypothetical protein [Heyndrickxia oleronia]